ncbi:MAG TPA: dephospho-CoA kinase [Pricia sp.]|nr:dephospho-CoA kinase [Pricia sp.]
MMFIGLTGGIGSGKTTVAQFFKALGVPVYNSDNEAKKLMETSHKVKTGIKNLLGEEAYSGQRLNKTYVSQRVFNNRPLLQKLNGIVHPAVRSHFLAWAKKQNAPYVIQEAAIIFEIGSEDFYDKIILVTAPETLRIDRIMERDPDSTPERIQARMRNQWSDSQKIALSDYIIENCDLAETESQVLQLHRSLLAEA